MKKYTDCNDTKKNIHELTVKNTSAFSDIKKHHLDDRCYQIHEGQEGLCLQKIAFCFFSLSLKQV